MDSTTSTDGVPTAAELDERWGRVVGRRGFLVGVGAAGAAALTSGGLATAGAAFASGGRLSSGDAAILRFLAAAEILETDLWQQYTELGGVNGGNPAYIGRAREPRRRHAAVHLRQHRRRAQPRRVPERLSAVEGRGRGEPRRVPHAAEQQGDRREADRPADQPDEAERRHELVHPLPQPPEPGLRRDVPAGGPHPGRAGHPAERRGHAARHVPAGAADDAPSSGGCRRSRTPPASTSP